MYSVVYDDEYCAGEQLVFGCRQGSSKRSDNTVGQHVSSRDTVTRMFTTYLAGDLSL